MCFCIAACFPLHCLRSPLLLRAALPAQSVAAKSNSHACLYHDCQPSRTRLMQHHACVRSAAWPCIHQFYSAKIDWPLCIKYWSEENWNEPVWLQRCCACGQICGQIRAFSDAADQGQTVPASLRTGIKLAEMKLHGTSVPMLA